jgi:hypothetical protein
MLGKTLHIRNSGFRMLPNPTPYSWDKNFFNLCRLVREYRKQIGDDDNDIPPISQIQQLTNDSWKVVRALDEDKNSKTPGYSLPLLKTLHNVLDKCDKFLKESDRDLLRMVVREHFQEILRLINAKRGSDGVDGDDGRSTRSGDNLRAEHFNEITAASPELRQQAFMELYFFKVLKNVRQRAVTSYGRQQTTRSREPSIDSTQQEAKVEDPASPMTSVTPSRPVSPVSPLPTARLRKHETNQSVPTLRIQPPDRASHQFLGEDLTVSLESQVSAIWCTLVLRMMCWLLLHDFNEKDVQIPKSELLGSRIPVYIA